MLERERTLYAFTTNYIRKLLVDLPDETLRRPGAAGLNSPLWILGHLAVVADFGLKLLGQTAKANPATIDAALKEFL